MKEYTLPLKVLWMWNCNDAEITLDFQLKNGGKTYQVKGKGKGAIDSNGQLKICLSDNLESIFLVNPNKQVIIQDGANLKRIWDYWKKDEGEKIFDALIQETQSDGETQAEIELKEVNPTIEKVKLTPQQILNLVFEMEFLLAMQKKLKGEVSQKQINGLIKVCTEGFEKDDADRIKSEFEKKIKTIIE